MQHNLADPGHQMEMYCIDGEMIYEVNTALIRLISEPEVSVRLSNQASRLLYLLVSHAGVEMERADLIYRVWEKHGFSGSSVSLNVSVSQIRKAFRELGHDPGLISTLRKKGFCLRAQVERLHCASEPATAGDALSTLADAGNTLRPHESEAEPVADAAPAFWRMPRAAGLALAILLLSLVLFVFHRWQGNNAYASGDVIDDRPVLVGAYGQCSLFVLNADDAHSADYPSLIQQRLVHEQIDCDNNKADVYFTRTRKHLFDNTFMSICYLQPDKALYSRCVSYRRLEDSHDGA